MSGQRKVKVCPPATVKARLESVSCAAPVVTCTVPDEVTCPSGVHVPWSQNSQTSVTSEPPPGLVGKLSVTPSVTRAFAFERTSSLPR